MTHCYYLLSILVKVLGVVHKGRPHRGWREGWLRCRQGGAGFDCMRMSTTQYHSNACCSGMQLRTVSYHPYSDGSGCTKRTAKVVRCLLSVAPWSVSIMTYSEFLFWSNSTIIFD